MQAARKSENSFLQHAISQRAYRFVGTVGKVLQTTAANLGGALICDSQ